MKSDLVKDSFAPEKWRLASWDASQVKGKRRVILPVPKSAVDHLNNFFGLCDQYEKSALLFPSAQDVDKNVTGSGAYQILSRLAGKDRNKPKSDAKRPVPKEPWPDMLVNAGIDWWSPHDIRRTLADFLSSAGYPGGASAVLSHSIKDPTVLGFSQNDQLCSALLGARLGSRLGALLSWVRHSARCATWLGALLGSACRSARGVLLCSIKKFL